MLAGRCGARALLSTSGAARVRVPRRQDRRGRRRLRARPPRDRIFRCRYLPSGQIGLLCVPCGVSEPVAVAQIAGDESHRPTSVSGPNEKPRVLSASSIPAGQEPVVPDLLGLSRGYDRAARLPLVLLELVSNDLLQEGGHRPRLPHNVIRCVVIQSATQGRYFRMTTKLCLKSYAPDLDPPSHRIGVEKRPNVAAVTRDDDRRRASQRLDGDECVDDIMEASRLHESGGIEGPL